MSIVIAISAMATRVALLPVNFIPARFLPCSGWGVMVRTAALPGNTLQLGQTCQHFISGLYRTAVDLVGALGLNHADHLLHHIDVGGFDILVHQSTGTVH